MNVSSTAAIYSNQAVITKQILITTAMMIHENHAPLPPPNGNNYESQQ